MFLDDVLKNLLLGEFLSWNYLDWRQDTFGVWGLELVAQFKKLLGGLRSCLGVSSLVHLDVEV